LIDCDPGVDDALALLLAAASPDLSLVAVTTVAGNRPLETTTANASRILALAGREDVPVHAGCARPIAMAQPRCNLVHGEDGLGGVPLPSGPAAREPHASELMVRELVRRPAGTLTLVAVGPLTNLALAEIRHPGVLARARELLVMGGAAFCPGNVTPAAEFNFHADPVAAHVVLSAGAPLVLFGLDVTSKAVMPAGWVDGLRALGTRCGAAAHDMLRAYGKEDPLLHDACPVAWLIDPGLFKGQARTVSVAWAPGPDEGALRTTEPLVRAESQATALIVTDVLATRLFHLLGQRLAQLP
jgi:purine nucleosidase